MGLSQENQDVYDAGRIAGEAYARYVDTYGPMRDTPAPKWLTGDALKVWRSGYADGVTEYEDDVRDAEMLDER